MKNDVSNSADRDVVPRGYCCMAGFCRLFPTMDVGALSPREVLKKYSIRIRLLVSVPLLFLDRQEKIEPQDRLCVSVFRELES